MSLNMMLKTQPKSITLMDSVELHCFAIMLSIKYRLSNSTIEYFGDYVNWYRQLSQTERQDVSDLHHRIIDYIEHKIESNLSVAQQRHRSQITVKQSVVCLSVFFNCCFFKVFFSKSCSN